MWTNEDAWIERLKASGPARDDAIVELRAILLRGLSKSLNNRYGQPFHAEDIVQDALVKILDSLDQFEGRSRFITWAMTVANRIGISALRRKYHRDTSLDAFRSDDNYRMEVVDSATGTNDSERAEIVIKLNEILETDLTEKQRMALRAFLSGFSTDGIAERVGSNRNAVYKLLHDAKTKVREGLERAGITAEDVATVFA